MNQKLIVIVLVVNAVLLGFSHGWLKELPDRDEINTWADHYGAGEELRGELAPNFSLSLLNDQKFDLAEHVGKKVIVLNFFTTWCSSCRQEIPELQDYYASHKDKSFLLVGINIKEARRKVKDFVVNQDITFPVGIAPGEAIPSLYNVKSYPTTVVIGVQGKIQKYETGAISNASIAFDEIYKEQIKLLENNKTINKNEYLAELNNKSDTETSPPPESEKSND